MTGRSLTLNCIDAEYVNLVFEVGKLNVCNDDGVCQGYKKGLIIRTNYTDIEEHETDLISMEDIPKLIEFLQEELAKESKNE